MERSCHPHLGEQIIQRKLLTVSIVALTIQAAKCIGGRAGLRTGTLESGPVLLLQFLLELQRCPEEFSLLQEVQWEVPITVFIGHRLA